MIEELGPAVTGYPANSAERVGDHVYVVSLGLQPARLAAYDPDRRAVTDTVTIPTGLRCWAMAMVGPELYLGMWGTRQGESNLYRYRTDRRTLDALATVPTGGEFWSLAAAPDGRTLYAGTARSGEVVTYDRESGRLDVVTFDDPTGSQVTAVAATEDWVYAGLGRRRAGLVAIDRASGTARSILPPELADGVGVYDLAVSDEVIVAASQADTARVAVLDRRGPSRYDVATPGAEHAIGAVLIDGRTVYCSGLASGTLYAFDRDTRTLRAVSTPLPHVPNRRTLRTATGLLGVTAPGIVFTHDLDSGEGTRTDLVGAGARGGPERPQSLAVAADRVVVGSNNAAQVHAPDGSRRVALPGEAKTATAVGAIAYLATYPNGELWRIRPGAQPERVVDWPDVQNRPRAIHHDPETGRLLVAVSSDTDGGGALVVTDEDGTDVHVHVDPLSERQEPNAVASLPGGTVLLGGAGSDARLAAIDPRTGERRWEIIPVPGGGRISGLATRGTTVYGLVRDATLFSLDAATRRVTATRKLAEGRTGELAVHGNALYAVDGSRLVACHLRTLYPTALVTGIEHLAFTPNPPVRVDAQGRLHVFRGTDLLRVTDSAREPGPP